jgi:hypothetical protein
MYKQTSQAKTPESTLKISKSKKRAGGAWLSNPKITKEGEYFSRKKTSEIFPVYRRLYNIK